ncbi:hypothetical protein B0H17DRAFT_1207863 [Mycena rosella]|uniref:Uncharacterized protein n=1 Tax=Mycena rosella TaxID=1033263 RepID=A0AAD7D2G0_MYCRO|nr:hypothetical protein B0H17DRAFT_1207863 [Mycena rosella]
MSASSSSPSARRLALHPSALSDGENALFTLSLADLADTTGDLEHAPGSGMVDEILHLFAPAPTLSRGAFFAALRLLVHAQAGRGVDRGLAFRPSPPHQFRRPRTPSSPRPPPEVPARSPAAAPAKTMSPAFSTPRKIGATSSSESSLSTSASSASSAPPTHHAHASSLSLAGSPIDTRPLFSPPTHPLRRASTHRTPASSRPHVQHFADCTASGGGTHRPREQNQAQNQNPFRPAPPPRRASLFVPSSPEPPAPPFACGAYPTSAGPRTASFALTPHPPVRPQCRASTFEAAYGAPPSSAPAYTTHAHDGRRVASASSASDSARRLSSDSRRPERERERTFSSSSASPSNSHAPAHSALESRRVSSGSHPSTASSNPLFDAFPRPLPLTLAKALRRTLAGAGWVGAERGEREGLVRGGGGGYTVRNGRRGAEDGDNGGEAWGAL